MFSNDETTGGVYWGRGESWSVLYLHACVQGVGLNSSKRSRAVVLKVTCPGASNWGGWDPGAATGQTGCLSSSAAGNHSAHVCMCILTCEPPSCSAREGKQDEAVGATCVCASAECVCWG